MRTRFTLSNVPMSEIRILSPTCRPAWISIRFTDAFPNGTDFQDFFDASGKHQQAFKQPIHRLDRT